AAANARCRSQTCRLDVLGIGADIADMREGEGDDLPGIGRIGQDLLIAGHRRVEADLADRDARGARARSFDDRTVGEHEQCRGPLIAPRLGRPRACALGLHVRTFGIVVHRLSLLPPSAKAAGPESGARLAASRPTLLPRVQRAQLLSDASVWVKLAFEIFTC